jgi:hypothetical protein
MDRHRRTHRQTARWSHKHAFIYFSKDSRLQRKLDLNTVSVKRTTNYGESDRVESVRFWLRSHLYRFCTFSVANTSHSSRAHMSLVLPLRGDGRVTQWDTGDTPVSVKHSNSWEANSRFASQEISHLSWNLIWLQDPAFNPCLHPEKSAPKSNIYASRSTLILSRPLYLGFFSAIIPSDISTKVFCAYCMYYIFLVLSVLAACPTNLILLYLISFDNSCCSYFGLT